LIFFWGKDLLQEEEDALALPDAVEWVHLDQHRPCWDHHKRDKAREKRISGSITCSKSIRFSTSGRTLVDINGQLCPYFF